MRPPPSASSAAAAASMAAQYARVAGVTGCSVVATSARSSTSEGSRRSASPKRFHSGCVAGEEDASRERSIVPYTWTMPEVKRA
eukprot:scaffold71720_cov75-Phaeocystis_antarctica.AAC.1